MRHTFKAFALLLLLTVAQQGAVVHELSHFFNAGGVTGLQAGPGGAADATCALCPAFAQVATPAFSHAFHVPPLVRAAPEVGLPPQYCAADAAVPQPRSRGPPSLS
jgi:hypothetical protein